MTSTEKTSSKEVKQEKEVPDKKAKKEPQQAESAETKAEQATESETKEKPTDLPREASLTSEVSAQGVAKRKVPPEKKQEKKLDINIKNGQVHVSAEKVKLPVFNAGDTITIHYKIIEGNKERIQQFKGVVLQRKGSGNTETCTVRKVSGGIGIERIVPLQSPFINKIVINKKGRVRRKKIFYLRKLKGKKARIDERRK